MTNGPAPGYLAIDDCRLDDFADLVSEKTELAGYPYAAPSSRTCSSTTVRGYGRSLAGRAARGGWRRS